MRETNCEGGSRSSARSKISRAQSGCKSASAGLHVGVIIDGNGRWAQARGLPRCEGQGRGAGAVRRTARAAPGPGISTLTLSALSADNWRRPTAEVSALMDLLKAFLIRGRETCRRHGVRVGVIGRRDRLPPALVRVVEAAERTTRECSQLYLRLAVDLMVRTSGEKRLSEFLLVEPAYVGLLFVDTLWPDFDGDDLRRAVEAYRRRGRRFGGLPPSNPNPDRPLVY